MLGFLSGKRHSGLSALLSAYIDGQVSEAETSRIERHLAGCEECRRELDTLRLTVDLVKGLPDLALPRSFALAEAPVRVRSVATGVWTTAVATSAMALLVVALLVGDALGSFSQMRAIGDGSADAAREAPASMPEPAPEAAMAAAAPAAAPVEPEAAAVAEMTVEEVQIEAETEVAIEEADIAPSEEAKQAPDEIRQQLREVAPPLETDVEASEELTIGVETATAEAEVAPADTPDSVAIPLWQLEAAAGGLFVVLAAATVGLLRRGRQVR